MNRETLAYLAGAMDSDGFFGIKRHTYAMRVRRDAHQAVYSERAGLKQVTETIPQLLKETFGGRCAIEAANTKHGKPFWSWDSTDKVAALAAKSLLPYLLVKKRQALLLLELRATKDDDRLKHSAYWFELANPGWRQMPLLTFPEVVERMGYAGIAMVSQAVRNGTLLALPWANDGSIGKRVPAALVERVAADARLSKDGRARCRPIELINLRQDLWDQCRELNRIGTGQHPISERIGRYATL
jgi:hypothetical protein